MVHPFHIPQTLSHQKWDNSLPPVHTISSGTELTFTLLDGGHNQIKPNSTIASLSTFDFSLTDPCNGPIYITDAHAGDILKVEILELTPADHGWTALLPGFGLLADEFPEPALKIWDLKTAKETGFAVFKPGIRVPLRPFLGVVGVAPREKGVFSTIPPYETGGNMDCKYVTAGSVLYLPIRVEGALFSAGDGHAAQGDGEVCGTAIETPMVARIRLSVESGVGREYISTPHYRTALNRPGPEVVGKGEYAVLGIDADLREAARKAVRGLIGWLVKEKGLERVEAYMLVSVAGDLKIAEAVDMPHYAVACSLPLSVFHEEG